jgi:uncharacterized membrane protein
MIAGRHMTNKKQTNKQTNKQTDKQTNSCTQLFGLVWFGLVVCLFVWLVGLFVATLGLTAENTHKDSAFRSW